MNTAVIALAKTQKSVKWPLECVLWSKLHPNHGLNIWKSSGLGARSNFIHMVYTVEVIACYQVLVVE
jgi:hypothetical protein